MAMSRGSYTTVSTSTSSSTQQSQHSKSEKLTTIRAAEYRPLRSPIDSSSALWNEGRRKRIVELEAQLQQDDARRRLEEGNRQREAREAKQSDQSWQSTRSGSRVSGEVNGCVDRGRRETRVPAAGPAATVEAAGGETEDRSDRCRLREGGTYLPGALSNIGLSLEQRLSLWERGWRPPPLRELPRGGEGFFSGWTHLGQPERFELVKSTNRSLGSHDAAALTDAELEWAVLSLEDAEERMNSLQFSEAANVLENVLIRCPGLTLAYYRLTLCLLAARGAHASNQVKRLLDCAMFLEGAGNPHLASAVDLVLRMLRNDFIPEELWSEDHPKSLGDLRALEAALDHFL